MGKFMKFLYSIMLIVLTLLGAILIALGLGNLYLIDRLIYYIGQQNFFYVILGIGITLIVFAIIILIVLIKHRNRGFEVLIEDEMGSVLVTKRSLEAAMDSSIGRFYGQKPIKTKATIVDNNRIEAKAVVDSYSDEPVDTLTEKMREEIISSLSTLTGIADVKLNLRLDKKEKQEEKRSYGKY